MFYPIGINLAFYTLTVLNAVTTLPLTLNLGVVTASNLHMLFTFVAGGYGTFLLTRYVLTLLLTADDRPPTATNKRSTSTLPLVDNNLVWASAAIAGGFYAFASSKLFYVALGQFNIASNHWVPFAILYILRAHHQPQRLKNSVLAGLFLTLQAWTEMTYASFLLVFIGLYWLYRILTALAQQRISNRQTIFFHLRTAVIMGLTFAIGIMPILVQMLPDMQVEGDFLVEGAGFADVFSADLLGFFIPTMHHPLLGHLISQTNITSFDKGQHIYIGFVLLGLMVVALFTGYRQAQLRFWFIAIAAFALLALGPVINFNGQATGVDGPFTIFQTLPFFKGNRYPSRYSVMLMLSLSVMAAFGLAKVGSWAKTRRYWMLALISGIFLFEHLSLPLPQSDMRVPAAYQLIAADSDDVTVLDIPFAWRNGFRITGAFTNQFMFGQFYQTVHQKRLLQGNTSRNPEFKFQYFTIAPVLNSLLALETGKILPPKRWEADRAIAREVLDFFNIKYIVVRPDESNNPIVTPQATIPYIEDVLPVEKIHDEAGIKIYRVKDSPQESRLKSGLLINSNNPLASLYFGEGWGLLSPGHAITAQREEVRLLLPLTTAPQRITLRMRLPEAAQATSRSVYLELNGWQSTSQQVEKEWQEYTFEIPADIIQSHLSDLRLHFDGVTTLRPLRPETPAIDVTVLSAGEEVGGFGHIFVNGYDVSPNQRGYNVAIFGLGDTPHLSTAYFDTFQDSAASAELVAFVSAAPPSAFLAIAAADEASFNLNEEAVQTIQKITGASGDLRGCFRCSHAIISEVGTPDSRVIEALDPLRPVGITTNLGLTEPHIAVVVDWIRVEALEQ